MANNTSVAKENTAKGGDRRALIIVIALVSALVLVGAGFLIDYLIDYNAPLNVADTGETFEGEYAVKISSSGFSTQASYTFDGRKVTEKYYDTSAQETVTNEYTYVIAIENGEKVIKLTVEASGKTTTHDFYTGSMNGDPFISINEQHYYKTGN